VVTVNATCLPSGDIDGLLTVVRRNQSRGANARPPAGRCAGDNVAKKNRLARISVVRLIIVSRREKRTSSARTLERDATADNSESYARIAQRFGRDFSEVAVDDDQVGQLSGNE